MGQKAHPFGLRLGSFYTWTSRWYARGNEYIRLLHEDLSLRKVLQEKLKLAGVVRVDIERSINTIAVILHVSRPGVVIGRGGSGLEEIKRTVYKQLKINPRDSKAMKVELKVEEVKNPDLSARLVAQRVVDQLAHRYPHRRAVSQALEKVMEAGAGGVKIVLAGRIAGAEISRREKYALGSVPSQTLRADIDYAEIPAFTRSGYIGVKVWIYQKPKGE